MYHPGVRTIHAARGPQTAAWPLPSCTRTPRVRSGATSRYTALSCGSLPMQQTAILTPRASGCCCRLRLLQAGCSKPGVVLQVGAQPCAAGAQQAPSAHTPHSAQSHASTHEQPAGPASDHKRLQQLVGDWLRASAAAAPPPDTAAPGQQQPLEALLSKLDAPVQVGAVTCLLHSQLSRVAGPEPANTCTMGQGWCW
jgi:hypothetical protein